MASQHRVPDGVSEQSLEIKKSRFIARAGFADSRESALTFVETMRTDFPDARHHCWAYLVGDPATNASAAMNDDGEPSGTAGKPILSVIQHKGIGDVVVVVARYFGGVKLGAGGLVRAYAGATEAALARLPVVEHEPMTRRRLFLDFALEQPLRHWAGEHEASIRGVEYRQRVELELSLPTRCMEALEAFCAAHGIRHEASGER